MNSEEASKHVTLEIRRKNFKRGRVRPKDLWRLGQITFTVQLLSDGKFG